MTWPASDVVRTNADATTDSPASFRVNALDLIDKFNQLRNHVTAFMQGLLTAANAPAARSTLGAAASGANSDITGLSALASLPTALMPLGAGQTWTEMVVSRGYNTNYYNTTGRPIALSIQVRRASGSFAYSFYAYLLVDNTYQPVRFQQTVSDGPSQFWVTLSYVVPAGSFYQLTVSGGGSDFEIYSWRELR